MDNITYFTLYIHLAGVNAMVEQDIIPIVFAPLKSFGQNYAERERDPVIFRS